MGHIILSNHKYLIVAEYSWRQTVYEDLK